MTLRQHCLVCVALYVMCIFVPASTLAPTQMTVESMSPHDTLEKMKSWYHLQHGTSVRVLCTIGLVVATNRSEDDLDIEHNATWSFEREQNTDLESWSRKNEIFEPHNLIQTNHSECKLTRPYKSALINVNNLWLKEAEVKCTRQIIIQNLKLENSGRYTCKSRLVIQDSGVVIKSSDDVGEVLLFIRSEKEISTMVVTTIILVILALFLIVTITFKLSGRRFQWQKSEELTNLRRNSSDEKELRNQEAWHIKGRSNSSISGIVFQANPESMARLMERLQQVDNESSDPKTGMRSPDPKGVADIEKNLERFVKQRNFERQASGPLILERRPRPAPIPRRSSLGILPSTIAIGSGICINDNYDDCYSIKRVPGNAGRPTNLGGGRILLDESRKGSQGVLSSAPLHFVRPGSTRVFRDVSISSARVRLNSDEETIAEEIHDEEK